MIVYGHCPYKNEVLIMQTIAQECYLQLNSTLYCTHLGGQDNNIKQNGTEMCQAQENLCYAMSSLFWCIYQKGFVAKHALFSQIVKTQIQPKLN